MSARRIEGVVSKTENIWMALMEYAGCHLKCLSLPFCFINANFLPGQQEKVSIISEVYI